MIHDAGAAPTWCIHEATPCPMPACTRPGKAPASVASSIAVKAALRTTAGRIPMPTITDVVAASASVAVVSPPVKKQSSTTHTSSKPASSHARATRADVGGRHLAGQHDADRAVAAAGCGQGRRHGQGLPARWRRSGPRPPGRGSDHRRGAHSSYRRGSARALSPPATSSPAQTSSAAR